MRDVYDVAIIGMGAVGTATGFLLAEFTNVQSLLFLEKENSAGQIASDRRTNSQTRHPFGGELNYTPEVMKAIKRYSDMIPSYANSKYGRGYDILRRTKSGMVLAVGENEKDYLRKKFHDTVKPVFPYAELMEDKEEIAKLEPYVVRGRKKDEEIGIIKLQADMVDFGELARSFEDNAPSIKTGESVSSSTREWNELKMSQTAMKCTLPTAEVSRPDMSWSPRARTRSRSRNNLAWAATSLPFR